MNSEILKQIGDAQKKILRRYYRRVLEINKLEPKYQDMDDEELAEQTDVLKDKLQDLMKKDARKPLEKAVKGMLQHNTLGDAQFQKLKVYAGPNHPHEAQKPIAYEIKGDK